MQPMNDVPSSKVSELESLILEFMGLGLERGLAEMFARTELGLDT